jgi:hypothetical protein
MNLKALGKYRLFRRISMDLDSKDRWELFRVTDYLEYNLGQFPEVRETTKGFHVWLDLKKDHNIPIQKIMALRKFLGDDPLRISFDMCWAGKGWKGDALFIIRRGKRHYIKRDKKYCITGR